MFRTATIITAAIGIAGLMATTVQADTLRSYATDFSSQNKKGRPVTATRKTFTAPARTTTVTATRKTFTAPARTTTVTATRKTFTATGKPTAVTATKKTFTATGTQTSNPNINKKFNPNTPGQAAIGNQGGNALKGNAIKFQAGPGQVSKVAFKPAPHIKFVKLGQFSAPVWKSGPKKVWYGNKWKVFVPLTALGVVVLGGAYYYPDAYLTTSRNYCEGIAENGCRLNWQRVDFEDGEGEWQCVQYCRRPGAAPPPRTVALVAPPPPAQGAGCEIAIFSEPNFGGTNAQASEEQAHLSDNGWQNQIASVKVKSGTWDFFSDQEFTGETMRLPPGDYADLGPQWSKKAGSFMCAQP